MKKYDLIIGNPPYGKNSNLAVKFLNRALSESDEVRFVLPRTFRKPSVLNRIDSKAHLVKDVTVPDDTFPGTIRTCYQHWSVKKEDRKKIDVETTHDDFEFVTVDKANLCIGRVGAGTCGIVFTKNFKERGITSHYFIKTKNKEVKDRLVKLSEKFREAGKQTVGMHSLSKHDLISIYEASL